MDYQFLISALVFGLITGFHCVGMCGPIALALGLDADNKVKFYLQNLIYQLGRITTYTIMGLLFGIVGKGLNLLMYQQYISIFAGILLILMVLLPGKTTELGNQLSFFKKFILNIKQFLANYLRKKDFKSRYVTGVLNGLLPCGPVYVALTASIAAGSIAKSGLYMTMYGLGTLPLMFVTVTAGSLISIGLRNKITKIFPYITVIIGIVFILRGLELGIPFLSPPEEALQIKATRSCCH